MLFAVMSLQAQSFEGVITLNTTNAAKGEQAKMEWLIKNGNHKLIVNGTADGKTVNYAFLMRAGSTSAQFISDVAGEPSVFNIPMSSFEMQGIPFNGASVDVVGESTVSGFKSKQVVLKTSNGTAKVWVSDDVNISLDQLPAIFNQGGLISALQANGITGFPVKMDVKGTEGEIAYSHTITAVASKAISDSEFSLDGLADGKKQMQESVKQD